MLIRNGNMKRPRRQPMPWIMFVISTRLLFPVSWEPANSLGRRRNGPSLHTKVFKKLVVRSCENRNMNDFSTPTRLSRRRSSSPDYHGIPNPPPGERLKLEDLRERLIRQEESIIFALVERAQFMTNDVIYRPGGIEIPGFSGSFTEFLLCELEKGYALVRRYTSPDEQAFFPDILPEPILPPLSFPETIVPNTINLNSKIYDVYVQDIVPVICEAGDDQNYGSSAMYDVACLQAISKQYSKHIRNGDTNALNELLTDPQVEKRLAKRVINKASAYGRDIDDSGALDTYKVEPQIIAELYRKHIIPLTKQVEVLYLLQRLSRKSS
ncbi:Chorismate mutase 3, chloroplastic [Galdieria sulphuraria]|nr:Chorismate mutase 3, chloroplastic [Galdieria sulphuraria]